MADDSRNKEAKKAELYKFPVRFPLEQKPAAASSSQRKTFNGITQQMISTAFGTHHAIRIYGPDNPENIETEQPPFNIVEEMQKVKNHPNYILAYILLSVEQYESLEKDGAGQYKVITRENYQQLKAVFQVAPNSFELNCWCKYSEPVKNDSSPHKQQIQAPILPPETLFELLEKSASDYKNAKTKKPSLKPGFLKTGKGNNRHQNIQNLARALRGADTSKKESLSALLLYAIIFNSHQFLGNASNKLKEILLEHITCFHEASRQTIRLEKVSTCTTTQKSLSIHYQQKQSTQKPDISAIKEFLAKLANINATSTEHQKLIDEIALKMSSNILTEQSIEVFLEEKLKQLNPDKSGENSFTQAVNFVTSLM